jgi:HPt (histidine-containing phosphotransfer) domain-containing protein
MVKNRYSLGYLYQSFNNDSEEVFDMVDIYLNTVPAVLKKMAVANLDNDIQSEKELAHKLKTTFTLFEVNEAIDIAREIETGAMSAEKRRESIEKLTEIINDTFVGLKKEMDMYLKNKI